MYPHRRPRLASAATHEEALRGPGRQFARAATGRQLAELCRLAPPDLIVTELHLPDGPALRGIAEATRERRVPVIVVTADFPAGALNVAGDLAVEAALVKPVTPAALRAAVELAVRRFDRAEALLADVAGLRQQLADRKVIERAKGVVTRRLGLDEAEAYRRLRKLSSDRNERLVEVAARVLASEEVFGSLEGVDEPRAGAERQPHGPGGDGHNGPAPRRVPAAGGEAVPPAREDRV